MARRETYYGQQTEDNINITDGESYVFKTNPNDKILCIVQDEFDTELTTISLENNLDYVVNNADVFIKPNDVLDKNEIPSGNYNLKFVFHRNILDEANVTDPSLTDNPKHIVTEISNTRTEVRLRLRTDDEFNLFNESDIRDNYLDSFYRDKFGNKEVDEDGNEIDVYNYDYVLDLGNLTFIPINNLVFDTISESDNVTLIVKINEALSGDIGTLSDVSIRRILKPSVIQDVFYVSEITGTLASNKLVPDTSFITSTEDSSDIYQNYNQLVTTSSLSTEGNDIIETFLKNEYKNLNINFNEFANHTIFGNVEQKIINFDYKVKQIEGKLYQLSMSLSDTGSNSVVERRQLMFKDITDIKKNFTPLEKFLYYDNQSETTASVPGLGPNLADSNFAVRTNNSSSKIPNYDGFQGVYKIDRRDSKTRLFTEKYEVQNRPFFNRSGSLYLSFLMKATPGISSSLFFKQDEYEKPPYAKWAIPYNAIHNKIVTAPEPESGSYKRFVFLASASHWTPTGSLTAEDVSGLSFDVGSMIKTGIVDMFGATAENTHYKLVDPSTDTLLPIFDSSGQYGELLIPSMYKDNLLDFGTTRTGSVAPSGDLFNIGYSGSASNPMSQSFITDIKISYNDPSTAYPFSYISNTTSSLYNNWYSGMITSASNYDSDNIYSLINNLPEHYTTSADEAELRKFVYMMGEMFDVFYMYISNTYNVASRKYKVTEAAPSDLTPLIAQSMGWKCLYALSSSLAERLDWESNQFQNDRNATLSLSKTDTAKNTWQKVVNNLVYVYKSKGTASSLRAMLSIFGVSPDIVNIMTVGGATEEQNPRTLSDDTKALIEGLQGTTGNVNFKTAQTNLHMLDLSDVTGSTNHLALDWHTNNATADGFEFVMKPQPSSTTTRLVVSSGSLTESLWDLSIIPSASNSTTASLRLRINDTANGTGSLTTGSFTLQTENIAGLTDNNLWNVFVSRTSSSLNSSVTQTYKLYVAQQDGSSITTLEAVSKSIAGTGTGSIVNSNFISTGSLSNAVSGNLKVGLDLTGSIGEIRAWSGSLSASKFKQHVLNKTSVVGNNVDQDDLIYRYRLNEAYTGSVKLKDGNPKFVQDYSLITDNQPLSEIKLTTVPIEQVTFSPRAGLETINSNKTLIIDNEADEQLISNLSPTSTVVNSIQTDSKRVVNNDFKLSFSITNAVNEYIIDQITDFNIGSKIQISDKFSGSYSELDSMRKSILDGVTADINKNIDTVTDAIKNVVNQAICDVIPAKSEVIVGYNVESDLLHRNKHKQKPLGIETGSFLSAPIHFIDSASYGQGVVTASVQDSYTSSIFVTESVAVPTASFSSPKSASIFISQSTAIPTASFNPAKSASIFISQSTYLVTSSFITVNTTEVNMISETNLTDSTSSYAVTSSIVFPNSGSIDMDLGYKSEAALSSSWGQTVDDTHFIVFGTDSGSNSDYNIGYYNSDYNFITIGDNEHYSASINFVTCSGGDLTVLECSNGTNFDYTNFRNFYNQSIEYDNNYLYDNKYSSSINLVKGRPIGATLYFTESGGELIYPSNHATIVGSTKTMMSKLFYEGTQNDGSQPVNDPIGRDADSSKAFNTSSVAGSNTTNALYVKRG